QLIDGHKFTGAEGNWLVYIAVHNHLCTADTVVDKHEASRLLSVTPDIDIVKPGQLCFDNFAADRCGCFFTSSCPCSVRTVDVVIAGHTTNQAEVLLEMTAHSFAE